MANFKPNNDHIEALSKAKILLMTKPNSVFFVTLCFSLRHKFSEEIPTACTDGKEILFNPGFFMELTAEERVFLLLHETLHCAYLHMLRRSERDPKRWNIAADHVINLQLIERGYKMPHGGYADPQFKGLGVEEVYDLLPDDPQASCDMDLKEGGFDPNELQGDIQDALVRASIQSKMANDAPGTIPGEIEIFLDRLLNPKLPAKKILQKYFNSFAKTDYTFRRPNKRFMPQHYLPTLHGTKLSDLVFAVDTSGSVTDEEFLRFISEINGILRMLKPDKITLIQFDTEIKAVDIIKSVNDLARVSFTGRGGTEIGDLMDWINNHKPQVTLIFTDGHFRFRNYETRHDVVWLIHGYPQFTAPYGKVIHYEV